ncbi:MAG: hypothetical protein OHK0039_29870 [Bacteroidia bacterium]
MLRHSLMTAVVLVLIGSVAAAQSIGQRIERKVTRRVEQKVDRAIDDALDDIFAPKEKKQQPQSDSTQTRNANTGNQADEPNATVQVEADDSPADVAPSEFEGNFTIQFATYKNNKLEKDMPTSVAYHVEAYRFAVAPEPKAGQASTVLIYDRQQRKMTSKVDDNGNKSATIMPIPKIKVQVESESPAEGNYTVTATGRTKKILGYTCEEYRIEGEEGTTLAWLAKSLTWSLTDFFGMIEVQNQQGRLTDYSNRYQLSGMVLESETVSKDGKTRSTMLFTAYNPGTKSPAVFSLDGYQTTDLSNMFGK